MTPDGPFHQRLKCRANTPDEAVAAFLSQTPMIRCAAYRCLISEKECRARHARALKAKKTTKLGTMPILSDEWLALAKCRKCEVNHD
ncbi:MAG: hypothetical protein BWY92_01728 [Firmicutes bacterium ADurb.BinA052]|nr:MAG: hypothetical protein BWY92_01728 [Firmicutes bacterium ADurb.BinA052]